MYDEDDALDFEHSEDEIDEEQPSLKVLQAVSFLNTEAEEVDESDNKIDEAERSRQLAESVPLRGSDYVDPIEAVAEQWLAREASKLQSPQPEGFGRLRTRKGALKPSVYDEDPDPSSPKPLPPSTSPVDQPPSGSLPILAVPQAVVDFLDNVSSNAVGSCDNKEDKAWLILSDYLRGTLTGDHVKLALDELCVDEKWHSLRVRVMQVEPGDDAAEAELQSQLDALKPIRQAGVTETTGHLPH